MQYLDGAGNVGPGVQLYTVLEELLLYTFLNEMSCYTVLIDVTIIAVEAHKRHEIQKLFIFRICKPAQG